MTEDQYKVLCALDAPASLNINVNINDEQWDPTQPRTLLYGYTVERHTFHVYVDIEGVHMLEYEEFDGEYRVHNFGSTSLPKGLLAKDCIPNKRVYILGSDYEFCKYLKALGLALPFTQGGEGNPQLYAPYIAATERDICAASPACGERIKLLRNT